MKKKQAILLAHHSMMMQAALAAADEESLSDDEVFELLSEPQSPQLESSRLESLSRSRSNTPVLNSIVEAMNTNTAKMLDAMKTDSPIEGVLTFVTDTYNKLEKAKAKEFEREIMELSMEYKYGQ